MQIEHFEKGVRYTDKELLQVARKLGKLATYCGKIKDEASVIRVEAEQRPTKKEADTTKVMITVELPQKTFRGESRKKAILDAFDRAVEKLEPQLLKYKELHTAKGRASAVRRRLRASRSASSAV